MERRARVHPRKDPRRRVTRQGTDEKFNKGSKKAGDNNDDESMEPSDKYSNNRGNDDNDKQGK